MELKFKTKDNKSRIRCWESEMHPSNDKCVSPQDLNKCPELIFLTWVSDRILCFTCAFLSLREKKSIESHLFYWRIYPIFKRPLNKVASWSSAHWSRLVWLYDTIVHYCNLGWLGFRLMYTYLWILNICISFSCDHLYYIGLRNIVFLWGYGFFLLLVRNDLNKDFSKS